MALIKCHECGKEISNQAPTCPYCGIQHYYVYNKSEDYYNKSQPKNEVATGTIAFGYISSCLIPILGIIVGLYLIARGKGGKGGHGMACIVISINVALFGFFAMGGKF